MADRRGDVDRRGVRSMGEENRKFMSKQMGDACEMLVAAELTLAGIPAMRVPEQWPGYDVVAQPFDRGVQRISVKSRTFKRGPAFIECRANLTLVDKYLLFLENLQIARLEEMPHIQNLQMDGIGTSTRSRKGSPGSGITLRSPRLVHQATKCSAHLPIKFPFKRFLLRMAVALLRPCRIFPDA